jgi:hypothetical protein
VRRNDTASEPVTDSSKIADKRVLTAPLLLDEVPTRRFGAGVHRISHNHIMVNLRGPRPVAQVISRVVPLTDGMFAVQIDIPEAWPTKTAQSFLTEAEAEAWIERRAPSKGRSRARHSPDVSL